MRDDLGTGLLHLARRVFASCMGQTTGHTFEDNFVQNNSRLESESD